MVAYFDDAGRRCAAKRCGIGMARRLARLGICGAALSGAFPAYAAETSDSAGQFGGLEEITVTAQRRAQNIQDVGISIQAFSAKQLEERNIQSSYDIAAFTPGLSLGGSTGGQQTMFTIRGVTQIDFNDIAESPNATYLDDGYLAIPQSQTFALLDIDRVEVQKGPQGTLFGRNATGGLIQYITKKPTFDGVDGYVDTRVGVFDGPINAMKESVEAALGVPLNDVFAARIAAKFSNQDPYLQNLYPAGAIGPAPGPGAGANLGADRSYAGRLSLLYKPTGDFSMLLSVNGARTDLGNPPYEAKPTIGVLDPAGQFLVNALDVGANETRASIGPGGRDGGADPANTGTFIPIGPRPVPGGDFFGVKPPGPWKTSSDFAFERPNYTRTYGVDLHVDWNLTDNMTLTSVTDYKKYDKLLLVDVDGGPENLVANYAGDDAYSLTQEVRTNGKAGNLQWVAGVYYLHISNDSINGLKFPVGSITPGSPFDLGTEANLKTDSYSAFGQIDWQLAPKLGLILGGRIIQEEKKYHFFQGIWGTPSSLEVQAGSPLVIGPVFGPAGPEPYSDKRGQTLWAGKAQLEYHPVDRVLLYAGVNRGVKAGSYNAQLAGGLPVSVSLISYKPEVLTSTEVGVKSTWLDRRLQVNAAAFHYHYKDFQSFLFTGVSGVVINNNAATNGVEGSIEANPLDGLDIILGASYIHARVFDVPLLVSGVNVPTRDVQPTYSPPLQASAAIQYGHAFVGGTLTGRFTVSYSDGFYYNLRNFDADRFPSYFKLGLGADWKTADDHWKVGFDIQNLTDARIGGMGFDLASLCGCNNVYYQPPRFFSVNARYSY